MHIYVPTTTETEASSEEKPTVALGNARTRFVFASVLDAVKFYSNQTGHFPVTSRNRTKYVFIVYSYDSNINLS